MTALFSLDRLLTRTIAAGSLTLVGPDARVRRFGRGAPEVTVEIKDRNLAQKLVLLPDIALGEAYMDGSFIVESGEIYDFFDLCFANFGRSYGHWLWRAYAMARRVQKRLARRNSLTAAPDEIRSHYDLSDELYRLFLDPARQYSCAYYLTQDDTLEQAQEQKLAHLAAKLLLRRGQRVLDIGCGWGELALYLARVADVEVTGLTLSQAQCAYAQQRATETSLDNRVRFRVQDYRKETDRYDRIASVGMFEHVGYGRYCEYFDKLHDLLVDDGVAVMDTTGSASGPLAGSPWIEKYIFPGGQVPALSEIMQAIERAGLFATDIEILRLHYAETLRMWRNRFKANRSRVAEIYDERFCRMWEFYLASCEAGFRHSGLVDFHIQLSKRIDAVPITRDYLYRSCN
ncbi:class I SAM-dependent methyltransferase [Methylosinus sp. H3A]|uniref:SAM-dependent methyltransferase n=1 Tax=Methylosinus sp. H3A TaxID=2785786 RepID=UPI0018C31BB8|nr:cyclopropane-fatty-acyl-phospholipid synthase family protein [Methylosinus sp. H3A]MBG0811387.1 class I SAM-dependent methyltransferase [Methylosinus sp. H3A]